MNSKTERNSGVEKGLLVVGIALLSLCAYLLATTDQRVRAASAKISEGKVKGEKFSGKEFTDEYYRYSEMMAEIMVQIQSKYVEEVDPKRIFEAALNGVFDALDSHSGYLGPDNFVQLEKSTEGEFSGIGIHINMDRYGILTVISPIPGTPAARAGLKAWDRIVEIEGEPTEGVTTTDAVKLLTGPVGTVVNITVYRPGQRKPIPFSIVRNRIKIESVYSNVDDGDHVTPYFKYLAGKKIGYVRLTQFSESISSDLEKVLEKMKRSGLEGLILDLRYNSGGLLDESINVSDLFLDKGEVIVVTKGRLVNQNREYKAKTRRKVDWPMIVLVNESSASASEILAGALQDHKRAILVGPEGKNTYGKGLVQTISPLRLSLEKDENGDYMHNAIRLTTAKYYTPNNAGPGGKSMHLVGIEPDVGVKLPEDHAVELLTKGWLLGDPISVEPGEEKEIDMDLEKPMEEPSKSDPGDESVKEGAEGGGAKSEDDVPFYMKKKRIKQEEHPETPDIQLDYAVDLMKGLMLVEEK